MSYKKWSAIFVIFSIFILGMIAVINYLIDPYGVYDTKLLNSNKIMQDRKIRLAKAIMVYKIKPTSIILGTSRAAFGFDPNHNYFLKPSYNMAITAGTMYENRINFEWALKQGQLKQVLLVADYGMFTLPKHTYVPEFENYFHYNYIYGYLLSFNTLKDSYKTIISISSDGTPVYFTNGQRGGDDRQKFLIKNGGHLAVMNREDSMYYKYFSKNYIYSDTGNSSFSDFERIIDLCYENNIKLDIVFGPSHVRQWEALDYYIGYNRWLQWKKDVVLTVNSISSRYHKPPYRVFDFSVYHPLTAEEVPINQTKSMKYFWDSNHYKNELGLIVLDRLNSTSPYKDFGVELTKNNINEHLKEQSIQRSKYIDIQAYKKNIKRIIDSKKQ